MATAVDLLPEPPVLGTWPRPRLWTKDEYHRLGALGLFDLPLRRRRVELQSGEIWEQHHDDLSNPAPRPFPFTRDQFRAAVDAGLFDGQRVELVGGIVYLMEPMNEPHVAGVSLLADALRTAFGPRHYVRVQAPLDIGTYGDPQPDLVVVPGGPRSYQATPKSAAALLVVEVSDTTISHDTTTKAEEYASAGIADYWVLDLPNARLLVLRDPTPLAAGGAAGGHAYRTQLTLGPADDVHPLAAPSAAIRVADLLP